MRVAFFADIHANLPSLQAAFKDAEDCAAIVCCGDLVGYYAEPDEVCELVRTRGIPCVAGNHDLMVTGQLASQGRDDQLYRVQWSRARLSRENLQWLEGLPSTLVFEWGEHRVTVRHASPWDATTYLYEDSAGILRLDLDDNEILVVGHTHRRMNRRIGRGAIVNPGSVGQPRGLEPAGASFGIFDTHLGVFEHRRAMYDWLAYRERLEQMGWAPAALERLSGHIDSE